MGNTIPNKVDGTLKFETEIAQASEDKVGKHPIIAKDVTTVDIPSSEVVADWEERNDKAVTIRRGKNLFEFGFDIPDDENVLYDGATGDYITAYQSDMAVNGNKITGNILPYIPAGDYDVPKSYYLVFKIDAEGADSVKASVVENEFNVQRSLIDNTYTVTVGVVSQHAPHEEDEACPFEQLKVAVTKNGAKEEKIYDISGLILKAVE